MTGEGGSGNITPYYLLRGENAGRLSLPRMFGEGQQTTQMMLGIFRLG